MNHKEYLQSLHSKNTADEIIEKIVREGTHKDLKSKRRLAIGEANEVYDIELSNGQSVILRISQRNYTFDREKWAIKMCATVGVPVPHIIFSGTLEGLPVSIQEKVPGSPLEYGDLDFKSLPKETRRKIIQNAGAVLSKIHLIKTRGFGWIDENEKTEYKNSDEILGHFENEQEQIFELARKADIPKQSISKAFKLFREYKQTYSQIHPVLNHGDYGDKHIFVIGTDIAGIIDWGNVRSDIPEYDFANWDFWFNDNTPTDWLKEGYENKSIFGTEFNELMHIIELTKGIEIIYWYNEQRNTEMVKLAGRKFIKALHFFK